MKILLKILGALLLIVVLVVGYVSIFATSDLRTETSKVSPDMVKAKRLLAEMADAHKVDNWRNITTYEVDFEDEFYGMLGENSNPFAESNTNFKLRYIPGSFDGTLEVMTQELFGAYNHGKHTHKRKVEKLFLLMIKIYFSGCQPISISSNFLLIFSKPMHWLMPARKQSTVHYVREL